MLAAKAELPAAGLEPDPPARAHGCRRGLPQALVGGPRLRQPRVGRRSDVEGRLAVAGRFPIGSAKLYETPWFTQPVRVDVVRVTSREGAFTSIDPPPAYITIASGNPNMTGWMAAEVLFHEASHALVMPLIQAFGVQLKAQGKTSRDLWHVALFYLTGEVVRQTLEARNIRYEPYLYKTGLFDRAWPQYKVAIETHWKPYRRWQDRHATDAIKNVVTAIK